MVFSSWCGVSDSKPGLAILVGGDQINESAVIYRRYAFDDAVGQPPRLDIRQQHMDPETAHRVNQRSFRAISRSCGIDGILDQQDVPALRHTQACIQRTVGKGRFIDDVKHAVSLSQKLKTTSCWSMSSPISSRV